MIVGMDVVLYQRFCRFIALAHRHDIQDGAFHPPEKGFHRRVILGIAPPGGGLDKTVIGKELLKCSGHVLRPLVGMDQDARFMELAAMVTHHPVIRGLHKGYVHFQADGSTEDFCRIGILECTKVKQVPIIAMVQISDVSQDDLPWGNLEVLVYEIFRCLRFMVIGRPVLIRVLLRAVRNKVHFIHDPAALLYRDGNLMIPPQKSPEGALARHIAELLYNLPEQVLKFFFFQFFCGLHPVQFFPAFLPCVVTGAGNPEHTAAFILGIVQGAAFHTVDKGIHHQENIVFHCLGFDDVSMSPNTEYVFF